MALKYLITKAVNPRNRELKVFSGRAKQMDHLPLSRIAAIISDQCSVTEADVLGTYRNLIYVLRQCMLDSRPVRLGDFGSMRVVIMGESVDSEDQWGADKLRGYRVLLSPGEQLKSAYRGATYRSAGKSEALQEEAAQEADLQEEL